MYQLFLRLVNYLTSVHLASPVTCCAGIISAIHCKHLTFDAMFAVLPHAKKGTCGTPFHSSQFCLTAPEVAAAAMFARPVVQLAGAAVGLA